MSKQCLGFYDGKALDLEASTQVLGEERKPEVWVPALCVRFSCGNIDIVDRPATDEDKVTYERFYNKYLAAKEPAPKAKKPEPEPKAKKSVFKKRGSK